MFGVISISLYNPQYELTLFKINMEPNTSYDSSDGGPYFINQQPLPNSTVVLILGILSIPGCWCLFGLVPGIIALVLAKKASLLYSNEPGKYTRASINNMNAGKICAITGTIFSGIYLIFFIIKILLGTALGTIYTGFSGHSLYH